MTSASLLVHICCAVDSEAYLARLLKEHGLDSKTPRSPLKPSKIAPKAQRFSRIEAYFYNPNIHPKSEYDLRLSEVVKSCARHGVHLHIGSYDDWAFIRDMLDRGLDSAPEGGARCAACFDTRLLATAKLAKTLGISTITTTLLSSPKKSRQKLLKSLEYAGGQTGVDMLYFAIEDTVAQNTLARERSIYRQEYCGCYFALVDDARGFIHELASPLGLLSEGGHGVAKQEEGLALHTVPNPSFHAALSFHSMPSPTFQSTSGFDLASDLATPSIREASNFHSIPNPCPASAPATLSFDETKGIHATSPVLSSNTTSSFDSIPNSTFDLARRAHKETSFDLTISLASHSARCTYTPASSIEERAGTFAKMSAKKALKGTGSFIFKRTRDTELIVHGRLSLRGQSIPSYILPSSRAASFKSGALVYLHLLGDKEGSAKGARLASLMAEGILGLIDTGSSLQRLAARELVRGASKDARQGPNPSTEIGAEEAEALSKAIQSSQIQPKPIESNQFQPEQAESKLAQPKQIQPEPIQPSQVESNLIQPKKIELNQIQLEQVESKLAQPNLIQPKQPAPTSPYFIALSRRESFMLLSLALLNALLGRDFKTPMQVRLSEAEAVSIRLLLTGDARDITPIAIVAREVPSCKVVIEALHRSESAYTYVAGPSPV